jgi:hypothetical protein
MYTSTILSQVVWVPLLVDRWTEEHDKTNRQFFNFYASHHKSIWVAEGKVHILNLGIRERLLASFRLQLLYPWGKSPQYPLNRRVSGPSTCSACCEKEKNIALPKNETPINQPIATY